MSAPGLVLLDNTVLPNLALVGRRDLVTLLWGEGACTTLAVVAEYALGASAGTKPVDAWDGLPPLLALDDSPGQLLFGSHLTPCMPNSRIRPSAPAP